MVHTVASFSSISSILLIATVSFAAMRDGEMWVRGSA